VHEVLKQELSRWGAHLDAIYYCPHLPDGGCDCRKPNPGMLRQAERELGIDLNSSYMIGDRYLDIQMARTAGVHPVLVLTGDGRTELENRKNEPVQPEFVSDNLLTAVQIIVARD